MDWFNHLTTRNGAIEEVIKERRQSYRVQFRMAAMLVVPPTAAFPCYVYDFSNSGMRILTAEPVRKDTAVTIILRGRTKLDSAPEELDIKARVVWFRKLKGDTEFSLGTTFTEGHPAMLREIADFVRLQKQLEVQADLSQKRRTRRLIRRFPLQHRIAGSNYYDGFTRDLNDKGLRFASQAPLKVGGEIEVWVDLKDRQPPILIVGDVERCEPIPQEAWFDITVRTVHVVDADRRRLDRLLQRTTTELNSS